MVAFVHPEWFSWAPIKIVFPIAPYLYVWQSIFLAKKGQFKAVFREVFLTAAARELPIRKLSGRLTRRVARLCDAEIETNEIKTNSSATMQASALAKSTPLQSRVVKNTQAAVPRGARQVRSYRMFSSVKRLCLAIKGSRSVP